MFDSMVYTIYKLVNLTVLQHELYYHFIEHRQRYYM